MFLPRKGSYFSLPCTFSRFHFLSILLYSNISMETHRDASYNCDYSLHHFCSNTSAVKRKVKTAVADVLQI